MRFQTARPAERQMVGNAKAIAGATEPYYGEAGIREAVRSVIADALDGAIAKQFPDKFR